MHEKKASGLRLERFNLLFIPEYAMALAMAAVFALFCSARVGYYIIYFLLFMPFLSLIMLLISARRLTVSLSSRADLYEKGQDILIRYEVKKPFASMPLPQIDISEMVTGGALEPGRLKYAGGRGTDAYERMMKARYAGGVRITPERLFITDFLGVITISAPVRFKDGAETSLVLGIMPSLRNAPSDHRLINEALEGADLYTDSEDSLEETTGSFGGFPGYDHREYMPGDPVKRLNYKLSARRDTLFVRLDEKQVSGSVEVFLDPVIPDMEPPMRAPFWEGRIEDAISLCENLLSRQFTVSFSFIAASGKLDHTLRQEGEAAELGSELAYCFYSEEPAAV